MTSETATIGSYNDLNNVQSKRALLAGEVVFATMQANTAASHGFVFQEPRSISSSVVDLYKRDATKLSVALDPRLFDRRGITFGLAIDGYLHWGKKQKSRDPLILFGGAQSSFGINLDVLVFQDGRLIAYSEKLLPAKSDYTFSNSLESLLDEFMAMYPTASIYQGEPLEPWDHPSVTWVGEQALKGVSYRRLGKAGATPNAFAIPALVAAGAILIYGLVVTNGWRQLSAATEDYDQAVDSPAIRKQGGINTQYLDLMNVRRLFMEEPRKQTRLAKKAADIAGGIASLPNTRITEMRLPAPTSNASAQTGLAAEKAQTVSPEGLGVRSVSGREPDVLLVLAVPKSQQPAIDQAKDLMAAVAAKTGMSLRLAHSGSKDLMTERTFNIEGFIHD